MRWIGSLLLLAGSLLHPAHSAPEWYDKRDTWHDTLRASLAGLANLEQREGEEAAANAGDDGVAFGPWYAIGSFDNTDGKGFAEAYPPESEVSLDAVYPGMGNTEARWRKMDFADGQVIDLRPHFPVAEQAIAYLHRTIAADRDTEITGYFGSDDGLVVWLNGERLISKDVPRGPAADQDQAPLKLRTGENHLLLKIVNRTGGWAFYFHTQPGGGTPEENSRHLARVSETWAQVRGDFPAERDQWEMAVERADGIWPDAPDVADIAACEARYLTAMSTRLSASATIRDGLVADLGADAARPEAERHGFADGARAEAERQPRDGSAVLAIRAAYYEAVAAEQALKAAARLVSCRLAVGDLSATYGDRYPGAADYLAQIDDLWSGLRAAGSDVKAVGQRIVALQAEALVNANPLLQGETLLYLARRPGGGFPGLPQNWQGNSSVQRTGWDTTIARLAPIRADGQSSELFHSTNAFVGDLCLSFDAQRMLFSMPDEANNMAFQVWEIGADGQGLRLVTQGADPDYDNYDACYLPDGDIIFVSSRCYQAVPCTGGDHVGLLYRMDAQGRFVRQLTFDQDHSWMPTVLNNGSLVYTRWEYNDIPHYFSRILFGMNPDGTRQMALYGSGSYFPNTTMYTTPIPGDDSRVVAILSGHHGNPRGGEVAIIDLDEGEQHAEGIVQILPERHRIVEPVIVDQYATGKWPQFVQPYPLSGKYFLVSCKPDPETPWGIYLVDVFDNLVPVYTQPDAALFEPALLKPRTTPPVIPPAVNYARDDALVFIQDIYRGPGLAGVPRGTIKRLRLAEPVYRYWGNGETYSCSMDGSWDVKRILGTVPVGEDGSALFRVPANTPITLQPIDEQHMAHQQMRSWMTAMPGEFVSCVGCHERRKDSPPTQALSGALRREPSEVEPWYGPARGFSFSREVQPVLDKHCVSCHSASPLDLRAPGSPGQPEARFSVAYESLAPYVRRPGLEADIRMLPPEEFMATTSPLVQLLQKGHAGVQLSDEDWDRLITWIDLNVPYAGDWAETRQAPPIELVERRRELREQDAQVRAALADKAVASGAGR